MAKKREFIDNIAKYKPGRRSPAPKRRTDFSIFFSTHSSPSPSSSESFTELSCYSQQCLNATLNISHSEKDVEEEFHVLSPALNDISQDDEFGLLASSSEVPAIEVEAVSQDLSESCAATRDSVNQKSDASRVLNFSLAQSQVKRSSDVCMAPGNVVWAKTACQMWWPAEILGEESTSACSETQESSGHVLVQFYGNHASAWVDPERDISMLEDHFDEKRCNASENFQDALNQALQKKKHLLLQKEILVSSSSPQEQSSGRSIVSTSAKPKQDFLMKLRGNRERKPTIHFDEMKNSRRCAKKIRRLKIMRFLGLAAPPGSPFLATTKSAS